MSETAGGGLIYEKIPAIMEEVGAVGKNRKNQQQNFAFRGIDDIYNALHGLMGKHGVFAVPNVLTYERSTAPTKSGGVSQVTFLHVQYTFYAKDGSSFCTTVVGEAADFGDKSAGKAMSYAHKLALIQAFALETDEQQDPDYNSYDYAEQPQVKAPQPPRAPAPKRTPAQAVRDKAVYDDPEAEALYGQSDVPVVSTLAQVPTMPEHVKGLWAAARDKGVPKETPELKAKRMTWTNDLLQSYEMGSVKTWSDLTPEQTKKLKLALGAGALWW